MPSLQMQQRIEQIRSAVGAMPTALEDRRAAANTILHPPPDPDVHVETVVAGDVPGEWVWTGDIDAERTVLHLHPGGFVLGAPVVVRAFSAALSRAARVRVLNLSYRLAPEHPCPAAVEDAVSAYQWLLNEGSPPEKIVVGGQSAGACIALCALALIRDRGLGLPAGAFAISPPTDLTLSSESMVDGDAVDPLATLGELQELVGWYLGGRDPRDPLASPLFAELAGIPPLHLEVGTADRFTDDAVRFADAARRAGVETYIKVTEGAVHNFPNLAPDTPEAIEAMGRLAERIDGWCGGASRDPRPS